MMPACVASITPPSQMNEMGVRLAMTFGVVAIAGIIVRSSSPSSLAFTDGGEEQGTPIAGSLISANGSYVGAGVSSGVFVIAGSVVLLATRGVVEKRKGIRWV
jgi:hypothetical protein